MRNQKNTLGNSYVLLNMLCGKFKNITVTMYILAVLFVLKYIFL